MTSDCCSITARHCVSENYLQPTLVHIILQCSEASGPVGARWTSVKETSHLCWQCCARILLFEISLEIGEYFVRTTKWSSILCIVPLGAPEVIFVSRMMPNFVPDLIHIMRTSDKWHFSYYYTYLRLGLISSNIKASLISLGSRLYRS